MNFKFVKPASPPDRSGGPGVLLAETWESCNIPNWCSEFLNSAKNWFWMKYLSAVESKQSSCPNFRDEKSHYVILSSRV